MFDPENVERQSHPNWRYKATECLSVWDIYRATRVVLASDYDRLLSLYHQFVIVKPISEYHEDLGPCLWWIFPLCEPPYSGTPHDCDWPEYHTHFTRLTNEMCPRLENGQS